MKLEYSQIVRRKLGLLKVDLKKRFGENISHKVIGGITKSLRNLEIFPSEGISVSEMYGLECDYFYIYRSHNYFFYRIEKDTVIIADMFDEKEDFMQKLFGIDTTPQETIDYWKE